MPVWKLGQNLQQDSSPTKLPQKTTHHGTAFASHYAFLPVPTAKSVGHYAKSWLGGVMGTKGAMLKRPGPCGARMQLGAGSTKPD
ncbi:hypothetical protein TWF481_010362 [Arthrobotrys musiformis]|uniref:Uncharacterized protein n=1 Tax=Arthrobotrys musiformis TaxID=47236 RepID=A0AAV9W0R4_9PEZI